MSDGCYEAEGTRQTRKKKKNNKGFHDLLFLANLAAKFIRKCYCWNQLGQVV